MMVPAYPSHVVLQLKYNQIKLGFLAGDFLRLRNSACDFLVVKYWSRECFGF